MLAGAWYWCFIHQTTEFTIKRSARMHDLIGPYPTEELAREFGSQLFGLRLPDHRGDADR